MAKSRTRLKYARSNVEKALLEQKATTQELSSVLCDDLEGWDDRKGERPRGRG